MKLVFAQYSSENWISQKSPDGEIFSITEGSSSEGPIYLPVYHSGKEEIWLDEQKTLDEAKAAAQDWEDKHKQKE
jgi:hypothetical protein